MSGKLNLFSMMNMTTIISGQNVILLHFLHIYIFLHLPDLTRGVGIISFCGGLTPLGGSSV
jgi:hypothetical protein